jgi:hypothetical protein
MIPKYYIGKTYKYEASKVVSDFDLNYNLGTAVTYLLRAGKKVYVENSEKESLKADIRKAIDHLNFELLELDL